MLDSDSGFVRVLVNRLEGMGWQYRRLEAAPRVEEFVAMRVNALVVDLALLGPDAWDFLEQLTEAMPGLGVVVCTGRSTVAQRVRGLRMGADDWVTKPCHPEEVLARVEAVVRRRKQAVGPRATTGPWRPATWRSAPTSSRPSPTGAAWTSRGASSRCIQLLAARRGQGAPARGDLPAGLGLRDGPRRPLGGRLHPQGAPEARGRVARVEVHPHALRRRLPVRPGAARRSRRRERRARMPRASSPRGPPTVRLRQRPTSNPSSASSAAHLS